MKKIFILLFTVILFTGCSNKKEQKEDTNASYDVKKDYYVSVVPIVNHDDYNNVQKQVVYNYEEVKEDALKEEIIIEQDIIPFVEDEVAIIKENKEVDDTLDIKESEKQVANETVNTEEKEDTSILVNEDDLNDKVNKDESSDFILEEKNDIKEEVITNEELEKMEGFYSPSGKYLGDTKVKVIDVSYYQGIIDWNKFASDSDCYGVILRLGYYDTLDKMFERNINEIKRLNIPYGIYLFSYATTLNGALKEMNFTNQMINKYNIEPTLGIYYDIESWNTKSSSSNNISKEKYDSIVQLFINGVSNYVSYKYKVKVYSGRWYAMNRLGSIAKSYVDWVAEYNSTCKYDSNYSMWQYTSKGSIPGINGNVDISYLY